MGAKAALLRSEIVYGPNEDWRSFGAWGLQVLGEDSRGGWILLKQTQKLGLVEKR